MAIVKKVAVPTATKKYVPAKEIKVSLPKGRSKPEQDLSRMMWLIYGERKIGKTSLAAQFDDPLFMMFEPGGKSLSIRQVTITDWAEFREYIKLLEENPDYCKNVVIDTGNIAYEKCLEWVCRTHGVTHPSDEEWGKGWKAVAEEFSKAHERLFALGMGFVVTAHSEIKDVKKRSGETYSKLSVQLGGGAFKFYAGVADIIAYYQYGDDGQRELTIRGDSFIEAGVRTCDNFKYTDGSDIMTITLGNNGAKKAYEKILMAFANKLPKPKSVS